MRTPGPGRIPSWIVGYPRGLVNRRSAPTPPLRPARESRAFRARIGRLVDRLIDALSLYRNWELNLLLEGTAPAEAFEQAIFGPLVAVSTPAEIVRTGVGRAFDAAMDRISPLL